MLSPSLIHSVLNIQKKTQIVLPSLNHCQWF
jgi:hypothetical protein